VVNPGAGCDTYTLTASFEKIDYFVNYHTVINGIDTIIETVSCKGDETYTCLDFPDLDIQIPEGYALNPIGWTKNISGNIRNGTNIIYSGTSYATELTQYTSFKNLGSHNSTIDLYFTLFPKSYYIKYMLYKAGAEEATLNGTEYRIYGNSDYSLKTLATTTTGHKLTNKINSETGLIDSTRTNNWFISNEHMEPGDETITFISSTYANDIIVYAREIPN
jgi:hypothetical protein